MRATPGSFSFSKRLVQHACHKLVKPGRRRGSASSDALPFAVELHRASADGKMRGALELLDERRGARSRPQFSAFRHGFIRVREDH